jgi:hypothetical protein
MSKKTKKAQPKLPQNPIVVAMAARYSRTTTTMKHRTEGRGGARNRQRDYLKDE